LTKKFEEWLRGPASAVAADLERRPRKGEFVVLVAPATDSEEVREPDSEEQVAPADS
jgi:16S rRNA C1402 (ribose-2'-O) methylase RsmI